MTVINDSQFAEILKLMRTSSSWLLLCHENPDGDTLGCALALYSLALRLGKDVKICGKSQFPSRYDFLPYADKYTRIPKVGDAYTDGTLVISVDTSTLARSVDGLSGLNAPIVNIDHHADNEKYGTVNLVIPEASATAEIVTDLFVNGGFGVTQGEANALYVGLSTDNGNFRFTSTTPHSHICASKLLTAGADQAKMDDFVNENLTMPILKLWGRAFMNTELLREGKVALFWLRNADMHNADADASSVDGLVNMLMRIRGVMIGAFLCETSAANKVSIRTRTPYNARDIAGLFGGGGHACAAGAKIIGAFDDALSKLRAELEKYVDDRDTSDK
ncbi:MAG: DHH family phosphoesterase [Synergistaceae bacterium]|nr:DHH family phosphoesterase [Synergistaceae bacterium]